MSTAIFFRDEIEQVKKERSKLVVTLTKLKNSLVAFADNPKVKRVISTINKLLKILVTSVTVATLYAKFKHSFGENKISFQDFLNSDLVSTPVRVLAKIGFTACVNFIKFLDRIVLALSRNKKGNAESSGSGKDFSSKVRSFVEPKIRLGGGNPKDNPLAKREQFGNKIIENITNPANPILKFFGNQSEKIIGSFKLLNSGKNKKLINTYVENAIKNIKLSEKSLKDKKQIEAVKHIKDAMLLIGSIKQTLSENDLMTNDNKKLLRSLNSLLDNLQARINSANLNI